MFKKTLTGDSAGSNRRENKKIKKAERPTEEQEHTIKDERKWRKECATENEKQIFLFFPNFRPFPHLRGTRGFRALISAGRILGTKL